MQERRVIKPNVTMQPDLKSITVKTRPAITVEHQLRRVGMDYPLLHREWLGHTVLHDRVAALSVGLGPRCAEHLAALSITLRAGCNLFNRGDIVCLETSKHRL